MRFRAAVLKCQAKISHGYRKSLQGLTALSLCIWCASLPAQGKSGSDLGGMVDRYLTTIAEPYWNTHKAALVALATPEDVRAYQAKQRETFFQIIGKLPEKTPLHPHITGTLVRGGYRIERLYFESRPGFYVTADLYVPTIGKGPYPAVLGVAGHGDPAKAYDTYQLGWVGLVRRGFVVFAVDPLGQGERVQYYEPELGMSRVGIGTAEHTLVGQQTILTGAPLAQYFIWDDIRAIDYLVTRKEVDPSRLGIAGNSGGGMQSAYQALADSRLAAAAPSCWMNSSSTMWSQPAPQDAEQNIPFFISRGLDVSDYAAAFAGKPFLFLTATRDFFPISGAKKAYADARLAYEAAGAEDHLGFFEYDDEHSWSKPRREATYAWFQHWLSAPSAVHPEDTLITEKESDLWATPTGQLETSLRGETVQSLNLKLAESEQVHRPLLDEAALRAQILKTLGIKLAPHTSPVAVKIVRTQKFDQYKQEDLVLTTEDGIAVPSLLLIPTAGDKHPVTIYIHPEGKDDDIGPAGDMLALVRAGQTVFAPDLRGWGETANTKGHGAHDGRYQTATRALLIGKTMTGMRTFDLIRCVDFLTTRADVSSQKISLLGKGRGGIVTLFAAALDERITRVALEGAPVSYMDMVRTRFPEDLIDLVLPNVLETFDLAEAAQLVAPRPLWLVAPRTATGMLQNDLAKVQEEYLVTTKAYSKKASPSSFRILPRPDGRALEQTYSDWLRP